MKETIREFSALLKNELNFLLAVKAFLATIPEALEKGDVLIRDFQLFMEKYEYDSHCLLAEKNHLLKEIAALLNIAVENLNLPLLVNMGYGEFEDIQIKIHKTTNEVSLQLLKISIFLKNYARLNTEQLGFNSFLFQSNYSDSLTNKKFNSRKGQRFYGEA